MRPLPRKVHHLFTSNSLDKFKGPNQSDFRVHFTLMNVKWKIKQANKEQKLVQHALETLKNYCKTHIVQISSVIEDDLYDLSVGLYNDSEAYEFLKKKQPILLHDGSKQQEYMPIVSNAFRSYMNKIETFQKQKEDPQPYSNITIELNQKQQEHLNSMKNQSLGQKMNPQEKDESYLQAFKFQSKKSKYEDQQISGFSKINKDVNKILAFGIPKQYQIDAIKFSLRKYELEVGECRWKNKDHMQCLEIQLIKEISKSRVYYLGLQIQGYPYVALPALEQTQITKELSRYIVEILIRGNLDQEQKFMQCMYEIGGVNIMLRTSLKQKNECRYVVVFNDVGKAELACRAAKDLRECVAQRKTYELRIGRLCKFYTFTELMKDHMKDK